MNNKVRSKVYTMALVMGVVAALLGGCRSVRKEFVSADLWGVVYDMDGQSVAQVKVTEVVEKDNTRKEKLLAVSDVDGRFIIPRLDYGEHVFEFEAEGYEKHRGSIYFSKRGQILHTRLYTYYQLRRDLEDAITMEEWKEAEVFVERLSTMKQSSEREIVYYHAVILYKQGEYVQAANVLQAHLGKLGRARDGVYAYLFLADIYEYAIGNYTGAAEYLEKALRHRNVGLVVKKQIEKRLSRFAVERAEKVEKEEKVHKELQDVVQ